MMFAKIQCDFWCNLLIRPTCHCVVGSVYVTLQTWSTSWWVWPHGVLRLLYCISAGGINNQCSHVLLSNDTRYHIGMQQAESPIFVIVRLLELGYRFSVPAMCLMACDHWLWEISFCTSIGEFSSPSIW